jgi:hypothetical protein
VKQFLPLLGLALLACAPMTGSTADPQKKPEPFALKDGDRVVLLGNTLIEREQRYGYWELALTSRFADKDIQFRNLGWSGDTVWGQARAGFGTPADGFKHLKEHVASQKPTVIIVGYGNNEAFDGEQGLPHFLEGLNKLLDALDENKARIVLLSPLRQEDKGRPLPEPTQQNENIRLYRLAIREVANKRGHLFCDPQTFTPHAILNLGMTDNGIHLTEMGYWGTTFGLLQTLGLKPQDRFQRPFAQPYWSLEVEVDKKIARAQGAVLVLDKDNPLCWRVTDAHLPLWHHRGLDGAQLSQQIKVPDIERRVRVAGLADGNYTLSIDGKVVCTATGKQWANAVAIFDGPEFDQAEKLRLAIIEKNRLYFHRWRPQNETYLFGFRKHEQGQNAVEIPKFDPLVAKLEEEIAKLRVPVKHTYELKPQPAGGDKE